MLRGPLNSPVIGWQRLLKGPLALGVSARPWIMGQIPRRDSGLSIQDILAVNTVSR